MKADDLRIRQELAGVPELGYVVGSAWPTPGDVALAGGDLVETLPSDYWPWIDEAGGLRPSAGLLNDFVGVETVDEALRFAGKWGLPELCAPHGRHTRHDREAVHSPDLPASASGCPQSYRGATGQPLSSGEAVAAVQQGDFSVTVSADAVLRHTDAVRAALGVAAANRRDELVPAELVNAMWAPWPENLRPSGLSDYEPGDSDYSLDLLALWVTFVLSEAAVVPVVTPRGQVVRIEFDIAGPMAGVWLQCAVTMSGAEGLGFCAGCGRFFTSRRAPRVGQRAWCDRAECKADAKRAAARDYQQRRRARQGGA